MTFEELVYLEQRHRFAAKLRAIETPDPLQGSAWHYDGDAAREARIALVQRQRRIDSTKPELLPYDEFLDSPYWIWLSLWMKGLVEYYCEGCERKFPSEKGLDVHHKTYTHRGFEFPDHLDDLIVLCRACHRRRHFPAGGRR